MVSVFRYSNQQPASWKKPLTFEPVDIGFRAGDPLPMNRLQNFSVTLQESGELESIRDRCIKNASWLEHLP